MCVRWGFLAFCALIVIAQLMPAITMMIGVARGVEKIPWLNLPLLRKRLSNSN